MANHIQAKKAFTIRIRRFGCERSVMSQNYSTFVFSLVVSFLSIHYLHKSHNTPLLPSKNLHRHCFQLLLGHFHVPGEIANNGYAKVLVGNRGVLYGIVQVVNG